MSMYRWIERRRYKRDLRAAYEERRQRMPWLQLAAYTHHSQHPGELRADCGVCNPDHLCRLLDEMTPLPEATS